MVGLQVTRRRMLAILSAVALAPRGARAEEITDLGWSDLLPEGEVALPPLLQDFIEHSPDTVAAGQPPSSGVRTDWNGRTVRMNGFVVPIEYDGTGVSAFILVPYVGACVHVPPPPANQLVFVTTEEPFETKGLFAAVTVTGMFGTAAVSTQLAQIGYALSADRIEPYRG
jgi:hypothetical protein